MPRGVDVFAIPVAPVSTLKINQQAARREKIRRNLKVVEDDLIETDPQRNEHYDPTIRLDARPRRPVRQQIKFVEEGRISAHAEKQRHREERRQADTRFREAMAARAEKEGAMPKLPALDEGILSATRNGPDLPPIEWWDVPFMRKGSTIPTAAVLDTVDEATFVRKDRITNLVHHPSRVPAAGQDAPAPVLPLMLTAQERKRMRKQDRLARETERREMVAVGLLPPPPPKVKLSNLMRVLANEATQDPTGVEADVRAQVAERQRKHIADNEGRRKTKDEIRDKREQASVADKEKGLFAHVYRILSVQNPEHRFKIDINARQLNLTGALVVYPECNLAVVEGGQKALRKFQRLMLHRLDWSRRGHEKPRGLTSDAGTQPNQCVLIWQGAIAKTAFDEFRVSSIPTEDGIRSMFRRRGIESYFDIAAGWSWGDPSLGLSGLE